MARAAPRPSRPRSDRGYDDRMQRVTITVPDEVLDAVRARVAAGDAANVSAYFAGAAEERTRDGGLAALLADLDRELGPVDDATARAVDDAFDRIEAGETGVFDLQHLRPRP